VAAVKVEDPIENLPEGDLPFRVEPRGVEFIPRASGGQAT